MSGHTLRRNTDRRNVGQGRTEKTWNGNTRYEKGSSENDAVVRRRRKRKKELLTLVSLVTH